MLLKFYFHVFFFSLSLSLRFFYFYFLLLRSFTLFSSSPPFSFHSSYSTSFARAFVKLIFFYSCSSNANACFLTFLFFASFRCVSFTPFNFPYFISFYCSFVPVSFFFRLVVVFHCAHTFSSLAVSEGASEAKRVL